MIHTPPAEAPEVGPEYLARTAYFDSASEAIQQFASETVAGETAEAGTDAELLRSTGCAGGALCPETAWRIRRLTEEKASSCRANMG